MPDLRISILFPFKDGPWGGGNQFLKALRGELDSLGLLELEPSRADAILVNSHHELAAAWKLKRKHPNVAIIHRVDGPVFLIRGRDERVDSRIFRFNRALADGTIFQSAWSMQRCEEQGMSIEPARSTVIHNAANDGIFAPPAKLPQNERCRVIATSWSANPNKGFSTYAYLDQHLDARKFEFVFVGNSPIAFKNSTHIPPLPPVELAQQLQASDIYITASANDPCSNALLEALACGLPAAARDDGGHPELVRDAGLLFRTDEEALDAVRRLAQDLHTFRAKVTTTPMRTTASEYARFIGMIVNNHDLPRKVARLTDGIMEQMAALPVVRRWL